MKKIQIRKNCFETNSSSQHTLVITQNATHITSEEIQTELEYELTYMGYIKINEHLYFGRRPFRIICSFKDKLFYAIAALIEEENDSIQQEIEGILSKHIPDFKGLVFEHSDTGFAEDYGKLKEFLEKTKTSIEEFLTNRQYVIIQDGDEYNDWAIFKKWILNTNIVQEITF